MHARDFDRDDAQRALGLDVPRVARRRGRELHLGSVSAALRAGIGLLRASGRVLLEIAPERVSVDDVGRELARYPQVAEVHDLHVWEIGSGFPALSAHVLVEADADCHGIRRELERIVLERFAIEHTTLQVDHVPAELLQISGTEPAHH